MKKTVTGTFLCLCLLLAGGPRASAREETAEQRRAWDELMSLQECDLFELTDMRERLEAAASALVPERKEYKFTRRPRFFWNVARAGAEPRMVLVDFQGLIMLPGQSVQRLYFFDERRRVATTQEFSTGWRQVTGEVKMYRHADLGLPVLEISTVGMGLTGIRTTRQFYAFRGGEAVLVRLEDREGKFLRNSYGCPHPHIGPPVPTRPAGEVAAALASADRVEVLRALSWLAGTRDSMAELEEDLAEARRVAELDPEMKDWVESETLARCPDVVKDVEAFVAARSHRGVRQALQKLRESADDWVAEAARAAVEALDEAKWKEVKN